MNFNDFRRYMALIFGYFLQFKTPATKELNGIKFRHNSIIYSFFLMHNDLFLPDKAIRSWAFNPFKLNNDISLLKCWHLEMVVGDQPLIELILIRLFLQLGQDKKVYWSEINISLKILNFGSPCNWSNPIDLYMIRKLVV